MEHCVGGYASECLSGYSHIVSIKTRTGGRATLQLIMEQHNAKKIKIGQLHGFRNKTIDEGDIKNAANQLVKKIKHNQLSLNPQYGEIENRHQAEKTDAHDIYPYHFHDEAMQEQIYQAYIDAKVLPSLMIADSYNEMLEKSGIKELIKNKIMPEALQVKYENTNHHQVSLF